MEEALAEPETYVKLMEFQHRDLRFELAVDCFF